MATYKQIQEWVKEEYGFNPKTCWIAHVKELSGLSVDKAPNRQGERKYPCPLHRIKAIQEAFIHFGMLFADE